MLNAQTAEEHLRVIRSLMEKATVYRAISAHAALVAGGIAVVAGFFFPEFGEPTVDAWTFKGKWLLVLLLSAGVNFYFLYQDARRRGEAFVSPGMRMAFCAMGPSLIVASVLTAMMDDWHVVPMWQLTYGLALLSTVHFAPRSLALLGWAFLGAGLAMLVWAYLLKIGMPTVYGRSAPDLVMAGTFGVFHMLYALCTWPRHAPAVTEAQ